MALQEAANVGHSASVSLHNAYKVTATSIL